MGLQASSIAGYQLRLVDIPLTEPFAIAGGAPDTARSVFVEVRLADGSLGYGESAPFEAVSGETQESTVAALRSVANIVVGANAAHWRDLAASVGRSLTAAPAARCGIEQAVLDALARSRGLPLVEFFGGRPIALTTDLTIPASSAAHAAESAKAADAAGFRTVKMKVGAGGWRDDVERLAATAAAVPGLRIIADANGGFTPGDAHRFLVGLQRAGIRLSLFEQPVSANDLASLARLEHEHGVPVCADESVRSAADAVALVRHGGISAINVKLMKCGVVEALDILAVSRAAGLTCMIGGMVESSVAMSFSAALAMAAGPVIGYVDLDTPLFMANDVVSGGMVYRGESVTLRDLPGTGIDAARWFSAE